MAAAIPGRAFSRQSGGHKKLRLLPVIIILISTVLAIMGADLTLRLFGKKMLYYRPNEMFLDRWPKLPLVSRYQKNVHYECETFGDLAAMQSDVHLREKRRVVFETDGFGFRNSDRSQNDEAYDVIVLGDSFGAGLGTTQNCTWVAQLRERYGIGAYNLSIPGGGPWHSYVILASEIERLPVQPTAVVLVTVFSGNDLDDYYHDEDVVLSGLPWNNGWEALGVRAFSFVKRSPILQLINRINHGNSSEGKVLIRDLSGDRAMLFYKPYVTSKDRTTEMVSNHKNYSRLVSAIRSIEEVAENHGLRVVVVLFPSKEEVYEWVVAGAEPWVKESRPGGLGVALERSCRENKVWFIDLKPALVEAARKAWTDSGEVIYWADDTHWNEKGHGIVADIIHEAVFASSANTEAKGGNSLYGR